MTTEKIGKTYYVSIKGDNRHDGLHRNNDIHYLRTVQKAIDKIASCSTIIRM